jgi:hypothetical protein
MGESRPRISSWNEGQESGLESVLSVWNEGGLRMSAAETAATPIREFCEQSHSCPVMREKSVAEKAIKRPCIMADLKKRIEALWRSENWVAQSPAQNRIKNGHHETGSEHFCPDLTVVGLLTASASTGRLQLVDATGAFDICIEDDKEEDFVNRVVFVESFKIVCEWFSCPEAEWKTTYLVAKPNSMHLVPLDLWGLPNEVGPCQGPTLLGRPDLCVKREEEPVRNSADLVKYSVVNVSGIIRQQPGGKAFVVTCVKGRAESSSCRGAIHQFFRIILKTDSKCDS